MWYASLCLKGIKLAKYLTLPKENLVTFSLTKKRKLIAQLKVILQYVYDE